MTEYVVRLKGWNTSDRVVLIEDTRELQCKAPNLVSLRTKEGVASLLDRSKSFTVTVSSS